MFDSPSVVVGSAVNFSGRTSRLLRARAQRGFSLLEAIVALILISGAGMALFDWINGNLVSLDRIREANSRSDATINIIEYMYGINPMLSATGTATLGSYRIGWKSRPATAIVDRQYGLYQYALYDTRVDVTDSGGRAWFDLTMLQVGYKRVRDPVSLK